MRRHTLPLLLLLAASGCGEEELRPTLPPDVLVDTYSQQAASKVDVLWVVDNSGSMAEEQENLARNFGSFIQVFSRVEVDYRLAVTTTTVTGINAGQFFSATGYPKILSPTMSGDVESAFKANIRVGTSGSAFEAGLHAAELVIANQQARNAPKIQAIDDCKFQCNDDAACIQNCVAKYPIDFLRPDAYVYLIFVSDEEDKSDLVASGDVRYYWRLFETANGVGNDGTVNAAAIVGTEANNPCSANYGSRYIALTQLTGGEIGSICDANFSTTLRKLASNAVGLRRKFALSEKPEIDTIKVLLRYPCNASSDFVNQCASSDRSKCEGQPADAVLLECTPKQGEPDGWVYEAATNVIFFSGDSVPGVKAEIDIQYYPEGKGP